MSFYPQPNKYFCGPFALKYALVMLGVFKDENEIAKYAGSTWWAGTDEIGLAKAAEKYNCRMEYFRTDNACEAVEMLNGKLSAGQPCILSVNNWGHWLTVLGYEDDSYITVDSGQHRVISILPENKLIKRWRYFEKGSPESYDGYAVIPEFNVVSTAVFTLEKARLLMYKRNQSLAKNWDSYFNDIISICRPRRPQNGAYIPVSEFFRRYSEMIIQCVVFWHGSLRHKELEKVMEHFQFIAEVYDLVVYCEDEKKSIADFTSVLMMYACGKYGMQEFY